MSPPTNRATGMSYSARSAAMDGMGGTEQEPNKAGRQKGRKAEMQGRKVGGQKGKGEGSKVSAFPPFCLPALPLSVATAIIHA